MERCYRMKNLETGEEFTFLEGWSLNDILDFYRGAVSSMRFRGVCNPRIWVENANGTVVCGTKC